MVNNEREERRCGLLVVGDRLLREYPNHYQAQAHADKYREVISMIQKQREISNWMMRNRDYCAWMEPETHQETSHPQQRGDHSGRRGGGNQQGHINHDPNSVDESDYEDDSERSDDETYYVREMIVQGSGVREINGVYKRAGSYDGVPKYSLVARYNGKDEEFSLFRCKLTDNTR